MAKKFLGFSLVELLVAITIMGVMAAAITLSASSMKQTAKSEAERITAYLISLTQKFGRARKNFDLAFSNQANSKNEFDVYYDYDNNNFYKPFPLRAGCTVTSNMEVFRYRYELNRFTTGGTLTVTDSKGDKYYVIIATMGGRIRTSSISTSTDE